MFITWKRRFAKSKPTPTESGCVRRRASFRPQVEQLEDRLAPAMFNVTSTLDSAAQVGALRWAILQSNATPGPNIINIAPGTYNLSQGALTIQNQSVTLAGAGSSSTVIDANGTNRVFDIEGSGLTVNFNGVAITGGAATSSSNNGGKGGAIYATAANVNLAGTLVTRNTASATGGGIYTTAGNISISGGGVTFNSAQGAGGTNGWGGGVFTSKGNVTLSNTNFSNNTAMYSGGGIKIHGNASSLVITGTTFYANVSAAGYGGAVFDASTVGNIAISGSTFDQNSALAGGALEVYAPNFTVAGSTFTGNIANQADTSTGVAGGAIEDGSYQPSSQILSITGSTFSNNVAGNGKPGGAVGTTAAKATFSGDTFTGNTGGTGGGLYYNNTKGSLSVSNSIFGGSTPGQGNLASNKSGGGVYASAANASFGNVTFAGNTAVQSGGGLYASGPIISVANATFSGNTGGFGGGFGHGGGGAAITNFQNVSFSGADTFTGNTAADFGGGLFLGYGGTVTATTGNFTVTNNTAGQYSGGVEVFTANLYLANAVITGNKAGGTGSFDYAGGLQSYNHKKSAESLTITNSTISYNSVSNGGGGGLDVYVQKTSGGSYGSIALTLDDVTLAYNSATTGGGGLQSNGSNTMTDSLTNVNLIGNSANSQYGGAYLTGGNLTMSNSNIVGNTAAKSGGGLYASFKSATISNSTFSNNNGGTQYGGLYLQTSTSGNLANDTFTGNQVVGSGGGLYWLVNGGTGNTVANSTFRGNAASNGGGMYANIGSGFVLSLTGSTFSNNQASSFGGGISNGVGAGTLDLTNDTLFGNNAAVSGGGLSVGSGGAANLLFDTFSANNANSGGGVYDGGAAVAVQDTLIAGDTASASAKGPDVFGTFTDNGHNLIGVSNGSNGFTVSTLVGTSAMPQAAGLGPLQNNGGPTFTANLLPNSPAIGAGIAAGGITTDQRGFARPGQGESKPSIGAFEYQQPLASLGTNASAVYVENLYETLLQRTADAGAAYWVNLLNTGTPASTVVQGIEASGEYQSDLVESLYVKYLHRTADPGGLTFWSNLLASGGTIEQVIGGIVSSPEYFALHGSSNSAFVAALYVDILGRAGSSAEVQGWVNAMAGGLTTEQVASGFLTSQEYRSNLVESYYLNYLGRSADPGGLAGWLAELNAGIADQLVLAGILGSAEAFGKRS